MHDICDDFPPLIHLENTFPAPQRNPAQSPIHSHFSVHPALPFPLSPHPSTPKLLPPTIPKYHLIRRSSIAYTTPTCDPGSNVWCKVRGQLGSARLTAAIYSYMHSVPGAQRLWVRFCVLSFPFLLFPFSHFFLSFLLNRSKNPTGFSSPTSWFFFLHIFLRLFF
jgi:hypothetical protein